MLHDLRSSDAVLVSYVNWFHLAEAAHWQVPTSSHTLRPPEGPEGGGLGAGGGGGGPPPPPFECSVNQAVSLVARGRRLHA